MAVKRNYRINLRNYGNPPAVMVSQYDENYSLTFEVYDGPLPASGLNTYTVKLVGTRADTLKYSFDGTVTGVANNVLNFTIDTTMTACAGKGVAEIVILDATNDVKFASFNLPVYVEKAAVPDDAVDADVERAQEIAEEIQEIVDNAAAEVKGEAESWAVGERDGEPVPATDPAYNNNAKYYAQQAAQIAEDISGVTEQVAQNTSDIGDLKEDLNSVLGDYKTLDQFPKALGMINSTGAWVSTTSTAYQHVAIPVAPSKTVQLKTNANHACTIGFLKSYSAPVSGSASFSDATGYTGRLSLTKNTSYSYTVPSDAYYLYILLIINNNDATPVELVIDGVDYFKPYSEMMDEVIATVNTDHAKVATLETRVAGLDYKTADAYPTAQGWILNTGLWGNFSDSYTHKAIPVKGGDYVVIRGNADYNSIYSFVKSYSNVHDGSDADFSASYQGRINMPKDAQYAYVIPSDTHYLIIHKNANGNDIFPQIIYINHVCITDGLTENLETLYAPNVVNWCVMGDSIAVGYHSEESGGEGSEESGTDQRLKTWVECVARWNRWRKTNIAVGGSGFLLANNGSCGYTLARSTDFTPYNLVTLSYGINDWKGNQVMGDMTDDPTATTCTTVIQAMRATIEGILASNPYCKIIVITPLNCYGYSNDYGDESTNYALGYAFSNSGTLDQFVTKMIEVCDYYGIQYIDMTHYSPINRKNLPTMVPDGVHPSWACHNLIAHQLSKQITF